MSVAAYGANNLLLTATDGGQAELVGSEREMVTAGDFTGFSNCSFLNSAT
jgi:hypothetical protein